MQISQPAAQARIVEAIELTDKEKMAMSRPHIGKFTKTELVSLDIPLHEVQRPLYTSAVKKYINRIGTIDWNMFGHIKVVEYPTGDRRIIDGQHRVSLVKTLSPQTKLVPAEILYVDGTETAAQYFAFLNGVLNRKINNEELLWAEVIARDPEALNILRVLKLADLSCGQVNEGSKQVSRATFEKCIKLGEKEAILASDLIKKAFPKADNIDLLMHGLTKLFSIKAYSGLQNNLTLGKMFREWFVEKMPDSGLKYKDLCFKKYQNNSQWQVGIAYGIMELFDNHMNNKGFGHHVPAIKHIRDLYLEGLN